MSDRLERLLVLRRRPRLTVVGLMSGTSADGVDAAVVRLGERNGRLDADLLYHATSPYPREIRERVLRAAVSPATALAELDFVLGERFATAALETIAGAGLERDGVDLVGSHGQTVYHQPERPGRVGCTLQIGQAAIIAERTGLPVVSDFRVRDMALGGEGAPLVPLVDHILFGKDGESRILLNIGGVANLSTLNGRLEDLIAFDTGPGNALMDALVRVFTDGTTGYDAEGERAARGRVDKGLLEELLATPFFDRPPPRSADRDLFGEPLARRLLAERPDLALDDLLATACALTVETIARSVGALGPPFEHVDRVIASGGGVRNATLMRSLAAVLAGVPLETTDQHGFPGDAKEAVAFAVLARQTLLGLPGNVPRATGARRGAVLGTITV